MKRSILLTGGSGLIGSYFVKKYSLKFTKDQILAPSHSEMDITKLDKVKRYFEKNKPEVVIHFAAFRDATTAEKQRGDKRGTVWKINVEGSQNIAKLSKEYGSNLIYISTDYVFSGHEKKPGPYSEKDEPNHSSRLLSWYGITKREGERIVLENKKNSIIRICNITLPDNDPKLDYVGKILWLYDHKIIYPMFDDQYLTLTYIPTLVDLIARLLTSQLAGIYHVSTPDLLTPYELANYLIERVYKLKNTVEGISINSYLKTNPRRYPKFGGLHTDLTQKNLGIKFVSWREAVDLYLKKIKKNVKETR